MLDTIEVLVPYSRDSELQKGQVWYPQGKNILVTGANGTGKTSLLHMIFESLKLHRKREEGGGKFSPLAFQHLRGSSRLEEITMNGESSPLRVSYEILRHADLFGERKIRQERFEDILLSRNWAGISEGYHSFPEGDDWDIDKERSIEAIKKYVVTLKQIARSENIDFQYVLALALEISEFRSDKVGEDEVDEMLKNKYRTQISDLENPLTEFFYTPLEGKDLTSFDVLRAYQLPGTTEKGSFKRGRMDNKGYYQEEGMPREKSLGEAQKSILDDLLAHETPSLILLDEPLAHLDEKKQEEYSNRILSQNKHQIIVASHDRSFNKDARDAGWYEIHLD
jgi:energy-coupling factor transporter ATP-binding protein EcfA2